MATACIGILLVAPATSQDRGRKSNIPKLAVTCRLYETATACNSLKEMVAADDIVVSYLSEELALACFRENEDAFFILSYKNPKKEEIDPIVRTAEGTIYFRQYRNGGDDRQQGLKLAAHGYWYMATNPAGFISKVLEGTEPGESFKDENGKLLISDYDITLRHAMYDRDHGQHQYELSIRRSTLRFTEVISNPTQAPTERGGYCVAFDHGVQQDRAVHSTPQSQEKK